MTSDANGVYRGVYTYGQERISVRDLVEVEGVPNDPLYYMYDGRGSVTQLTNAAGNVSDKYRYTPFGEPMEGGQLSPNTKLLNNPYGYNGEYHDLESGFQYLRARYYNPETARFITRDSYLGDVNEPFSLNRYAYTANNPVMKIDPSGHINLEAGGGGSSSSTYSTSTSSSSYTKTASSRPELEKYSDNKEAVRTLQTMLKTLHYDIGDSGVDGSFGDDTDAAVRAFQRDNGLQVDGIVGINTWTKLEEIYNNVIGTGIAPDNVLLGSNGSGGNSGSFVNSKVVEANSNSNNSNACDDLGGGFASSEGMYEDKLKQALKKYSNIKDPAQRVYVAWNLTSPEERLQLLKIDSRAYAGDQFLIRLSYLQYRKGIDVTKLSLNGLDKIYEEVHYTRVYTTMDYLNIAGAIAASSKKAGEGIAKLLKKTKGTGEIAYKKIRTSPAEDVNIWWKEKMGYNNPPYKPGTTVQEIELTQKSTFVRVYDGETSGMYGGWVMKAEDIKGLTPKQIQDKFALPSTPKYVVDVNLDAGTHLRTGVVNPLDGWGNGGGIQFDLMGQRTGEFVNSRLLP